MNIFREVCMSIGRIEIVDGEKQFVPYADSGGVFLIQNQNTFTSKNL